MGLSSLRLFIGEWGSLTSRRVLLPLWIILSRTLSSASAISEMILLAHSICSGRFFFFSKAFLTTLSMYLLNTFGAEFFSIFEREYSFSSLSSSSFRIKLFTTCSYNPLFICPPPFQDKAKKTQGPDPFFLLSIGLPMRSLEREEDTWSMKDYWAGIVPEDYSDERLCPSFLS